MSFLKLNIAYRLVLSLLLSLTTNLISIAQYLNPNTNFENGTYNTCDCPTGYICNNDASHVMDSVHLNFSLNNTGCVTDNTGYTNSLGAHSGSGYVYFYAGGDIITTQPINFNGGETIQICVWFSGPQNIEPAGQNSTDAYLTFGVDNLRVGPNISVGTNTTWTQYCFTTTMTAGTHSFNIISGNTAPYTIWLDDFTIINTVTDSCLLPEVNLGNNFELCDFNDTIVLSTGTINCNYLWQDNSTDSILVVTQPGIYSVSASNECGTTTESIVINQNTDVQISLTEDTSICNGEELILNAIAANTNYTWQDGSTSSHFIVNQPGLYWVEVESCNYSSDSIYVDFYNCDCALYLQFFSSR